MICSISPTGPKKRLVYQPKYIVAALALIWLVLVVVTSCRPQSTVPFEPQQRQKVASEQEAQSGRREIRNMMPCYEFHKDELERCDESWNCTERQRRKIVRDMKRTRAAFGCRIYFPPFRR